MPGEEYGAEAEADLVGNRQGDDEEAGGGGGEALLEDDSMVSLSHVDGQLRASSVRRLADMVEKHPEESLSIVRAWMQEGAG